MRNADIAKILFEIAEYLEMQNVPFKPRAFVKAAQSIEGLSEEVGDIYKKAGMRGLEDVPGVGKGIAERVEELLRTGRLKEYEQMKKKMPVEFEALSSIEGVGPKMIKAFYEKLGIRTVGDLEKAARAGKIRRLPGFREKTEENILKGIEFLKSSGGRFSLGEALPLVRGIEQRLGALPLVKEIAVCGSLRRWQETIGDADILIVSEKSKPVMDYFVSMPEVVHVYAHGETKSAVRIKNGMDIDLRVVPRESFGAAIQYFTGDKNHNVRVRQLAIKKGYTLNEYGLFRGKKKLAGETEEGIYETLGLEFIPPELRVANGELEAAKKRAIPKLIEPGDLKGDLQVQTNWTDGSHSTEEMAYAAIKKGLSYIAITDHTKSLAMTGGCDEKKLLKQMKYIDSVNMKMKKKHPGFTILKGAEVNILKDGSLDIEDSVLGRLDVVGASVHSHFNLPRGEMTVRILRAIQNPHVDILFHPTGRLINVRKPYEFDIEEVMRVAKRTGTVLEINAFPDRLDLKDEYIRKANAMGVRFAINSDAHSVSHFDVLEYGVHQARRGWVEKKSVVNAWPKEKMLSMLKK